MAATGKTPILLYGSTTATNQPSADNLTNSSDGCEIAINVADKNLFFKDSTNAVNTVPIRQSSASSNGWLSSANWTTFNGKQAQLVSGTNIKTVNGTTLLGSGDLGTIDVSHGGTGATTFTADRALFGNGTSAVYTSNLYLTSANALNFGASGSANAATVFYLKATNNAANGSAIIGQRNGLNAWFTGDTASALGSGTGYITYVYGANPAIWYINGAEVGQFDSSKNFKVTAGNLVIGTSGKGIDFSATSAGIIWRTGVGSPEGVVTAAVGSLYTRSDGGVGTTLYVKQSGTGNTGWAAK